MRRGRIVEDTLVGALFREPGHPYSAELLRATAAVALPVTAGLASGDAAGTA
jgi:ABC-type dipeptide/oligopeptide/nickel transport system ATPase component